MDIKKPYAVPQILTDKTKNPEDIERSEIIEILDDIAALEPGKNGQIAAKKISEKYKKIREAKKRKQFKLPVEIVQIQVQETSQSEVGIPVSIPLPRSNISKLKAAKEISKKYKDIRRQKAQKLAKIKGKEIIEDQIPSSKSARIAAKKIGDKYKKIRNKRNIDAAEETTDACQKRGLKQQLKKSIKQI